MQNLILKVAFDSLCFDYLPPESPLHQNLQIGQRVIVPFLQRKVIGVIVGLAHETQVAVTKLKSILELLDPQPLFSAQLWQLIVWTADYYHCAIGEVIACALPVLLRTLKKNPQKNPQKNHGLDAATAIPDVLSPHAAAETVENIVLNAQQQQAVDAIKGAQGFQAYLIDGITGSGKTEVYLQVIAEVIKRGKQALVLVPEISLTPQTVARFRRRFTVPIAIFHSRLTDKERLTSWLMAQQGQAKIIIGTRSAIFTPLVSPGIIILDEEHDLSFKQQSGLRYSARDLALVRAKLENISVILGSATPSLESFYNAMRKRYAHLSLPKRAGNAQLPTLHLLDLRNQKITHGLSAILVQKINEHLMQRGQVLLFVNRRGYAPILVCHACGWHARCMHCDANMTLHRDTSSLKCHHCNYTIPIPTACPECRKVELVALGYGTERLEKALEQIFPGVSVARIDRDTTKKRGALHKILEDTQLGKYQILVGTQMLAKGHHFPDVTLAAIINTDQGLFSSDFRASEHLAQLIMQVSGRAGRVRAGEVYIQTYNPHHALLIKLIREGYRGFAIAELEERCSAQFPPYAYLALLRAEARDQDAALLFLQNVRERSEASSCAVNVLGPIPAIMPRKSGKFRAQLLLQSANRKTLHIFMRKLLDIIAELKPKRSLKWILDVDPVE